MDDDDEDVKEMETRIWREIDNECDYVAFEVPLNNVVSQIYMYHGFYIGCIMEILGAHMLDTNGTLQTFPHWHEKYDYCDIFSHKIKPLFITLGHGITNFSGSFKLYRNMEVKYCTVDYDYVLSDNFSEWKIKLNWVLRFLIEVDTQGYVCVADPNDPDLFAFIET